MEKLSENVQPISPVLEAALAGLLVAGERVITKLPGLNVEAFVATDQRCVFLRGKPSPNIGEPPDVEIAETPLDQVCGASIVDSPGGNCLRVDAASPPEAEKRSIAFSVVDQAAFEKAAAELRKLQGPTDPSTLQESAEQVPAEADKCPGCGAQVREDDQFCASCGLRLRECCRACGAPLRKGAAYCTRCGSKTDGAAPSCPGCGRSVADVWWSFCPDCGRVIGSKCGRCGTAVVPAWKYCTNCGRELAGGHLDVTGRSGYAAEGIVRQRPEDELSVGSNTAADWNSLGRELFEQGKMEEALEMFQRAIDLDHSTALYHCNLAVAYDELDRDDEAADEYRRALELDPGDVVSMLGLGYIYSEREDKEGAARMWKRIIETSPNSPEAEEARGNLQHLGDL